MQKVIRAVSVGTGFRVQSSRKMYVCNSEEILAVPVVQTLKGDKQVINNSSLPFYCSGISPMLNRILGKILIQ